MPSEILTNSFCQFFPNEAQENELFPRLVRSKPAEQYTPAHMLSRSLGISSLALARITSSLLLECNDGSKTNIGLSLKFESKGMKVLGYTRKADRGWEFSRKAYDLILEYQVGPAVQSGASRRS